MADEVPPRKTKGLPTELVDFTVMHRFAPRGALQFIPVVLSLILVGCDGFVYVRGVVRTPQGQPVAGAKIHVTDMAQYWYTQSNANGCFDVGGVRPPKHSSEPLRVAAPGYKNASAKVRTDATKNQVVVTLVPSDSRDPSQIQLLDPKNDKDLEPCNSPR